MRRALLTGVTWVLVICLPAGAQNLTIPVESQVRPIAADTLFEQLFANFFSESDGTTYVQTGDIPAMWLRDSAAQTIPYIRFIRNYPALGKTFYGVVDRDAKNILTNPYAEAFSADYHVWEAKWEIDSLAWPVVLVFAYYANTRDRAIFSPTVHAALRKIVQVLKCEQQHAKCSRYSWPHGVPTHDRYNPDTGMIWSAFRPSDDPVTYRFNIPQNAFAVVAMKLVAAFAHDAFRDDRLARDARTIATQVEGGIQRYGRIYNSGYGGWMYVYETDGYGHYNEMDDANIPNLTALPFIGWCSTTDPVYLNTRRFTLSPDNPYYFTGRYATGLGSSHTPKGWVWPLGIIGAALTTTSSADIVDAIKMLDQSDTLNGQMHESVDPNDSDNFTRPAFGWANAFWAELLFRTVAGYSLMPYGAIGTAVPKERQSQIPAITPLWAQARNRALLSQTLGQLLKLHPHPL
ncbi:MAG TPA: glycoside hydrolase family 125 protein [Candidatus Cybelea sp.]